MVNKEFEKDIIKKTGIGRQQIIAMEECGELIQAISKMLRYGVKASEDNCSYRASLVEEIADVSICLERLKLIHKISDNDIQQWIDKKESRDADRYQSFSEEDVC